MIQFNKEVTQLLDELKHPLRKEIDLLREVVLSANAALVENIKWNGPNYSYNKQDRITMRIHPPKQIQLIFHRGAKVLEQPNEQLIKDSSGFLSWKSNDRAVATFTNEEDINRKRTLLKNLIKEWLVAASN